LGQISIHISNIEDPFNLDLYFVLAISENPKDVKPLLKKIIKQFIILQNGKDKNQQKDYLSQKIEPFTVLYSDALKKDVKVRIHLALTEGDN